MALETGCRVSPGIHNEFAATTARLDVLAAWAMARFATALAGQLRAFKMQTAVRAGRKHAVDVRVAIITGFVSDIGRARNIRRRYHRARQRRTGIHQYGRSPRDAESHRQG